jgi:nitroreductase
VDAYLALVSKRDTRRYAEQAIPEAVVGRVLEAGRLAGSSRNRQPLAVCDRRRSGAA